MRTKPLRYDDDNAPPSDGPAKPDVASGGLGRRARVWFAQELREILPPTIFFFAGFNLIVLTTNLILADHLAAFGNFHALYGRGARCWKSGAGTFSMVVVCDVTKVEGSQS